MELVLFFVISRRHISTRRFNNLHEVCFTREPHAVLFDLEFHLYETFCICEVTESCVFQFAKHNGLQAALRSKRYCSLKHSFTLQELIYAWIQIAKPKYNQNFGRVWNPPPTHTLTENLPFMVLTPLNVGHPLLLPNEEILV